MHFHNGLTVTTLMVQAVAIFMNTAAAQPSLRIISSAPTCATCTITLSQSAVLRLPSDSLSFDIGSLSKITRLPDGRFVVVGMNETSVPAILSASGAFEKLLARRGIGPGEIERAERVIVTPGDSVWVMDLGRKHVYAPDMRFVRTDRIRSVGDLIVAPDGRIVFQSRISSPDRAGFPLHLMRPDGVIIQSFGVQDPVIDPRHLRAYRDDIGMNMWRELVPGTQATFWTYNPTRFLLEQYDFDGKLLAQGRHALDGWYKDATARNPSRAEFEGMALNTVVASSDPSLLWLIYHDRNAKFRANDSLYTRSINESISMQDVIIEALDTRTMRVIASHRVPETIVMPMKNAPDLLVFSQPVDEYFMSYRVMRVRLIRPQPPR